MEPDNGYMDVCEFLFSWKSVSFPVHYVSQSVYVNKVQYKKIVISFKLLRGLGSLKPKLG